MTHSLKVAGMDGTRKTLVMGGAREAHGVIAGLLTLRREVISSIPEPERTFDPLPVPTRIGRFASSQNMQDWFAEQRVDTVIDASHAFDHDVSTMVREVCDITGRRYLRILRAPWQATDRDNWQPVSNVSQAAQSLPGTARAFSNTGWLSLPEYSEFSGARLFLRQTHHSTTPPPFDFVRFVPGQPPFSEFQEAELFKELRISHLICRNVGGAASKSKLLAARALKLPVLMVARHESPAHVPVVETVAEALAWDAER